MKNRVLVIGAGPAGLTAALRLAQSGHRVDVLESSPVVGGMARSFELWGTRVDVGPHRFFSKDPRVNSFWLEQVGPDYHMVKRKTRILYKKRFFDYPLSAANALINLGPIEAFRALASYALVRLRPVPDESNFQGWVTNRFGPRLFELFFRSYTEKLWGISCTDLDADFAAQRIKRLSLWEAVKSALIPQKSSIHRTLADEFAYPDKGAGSPYETIAERLRESGNTVHLNERVTELARSEGMWRARTVSGRELSANSVISTMPLTSLVAMLGGSRKAVQASERLRFRNTILVYLKVKRKNLFDDQWLYVQSDDLKTGRVTNFNNWGGSSSAERGFTILALEYWCFDSDEIWSEDDSALISRAAGEIEKTELAKEADVIDGYVVRVPKCYPVYDRGYQDHLAVVQDFIDSLQGLYVIGRYGSFKYNNQDHSILMGLLAAENISSGSSHNLWGVNADDEYQESSAISDTGLVIDADSD